MLKAYLEHVQERAAQGIAPKPLNAKQTIDLIELLKNPPAEDYQILLYLLVNRIPPGVDEAAYVKAGFLSAIAFGETSSPLIDDEDATRLLGTMQGGYNIDPLIRLLNNERLAPSAVESLSHILLIFDAFYDVAEKVKAGNQYAQRVMQSWADAEWFLQKKPVADKISLTVFKVIGETNTDDLSPAPDAWSRPDIPLHALSMLKHPREGIYPDKPGNVGPLQLLDKLKRKGYPVAYVGDVVGTGSSRKSATNSILWLMGNDIPNVPNKRTGCYLFGSKISPIFFNTMEDSGALPIEFDVSNLGMGDIIDIYLRSGKVTRHDSDEVVATFKLKTDAVLDAVRAGGRIPLIIGRSLTDRAREFLRLSASKIFCRSKFLQESRGGFSLAQKIVGKACNVAGVKPNQYCEPKMTVVGSQDTTGPMTRDELKDLACLGFNADLVLQSFCHTAAYPKPVDIDIHHTLPDFFMNRGGVSLRPGDGIIHSWLNRMLLPDKVGTGADSHTRFPLGISFPAGSGLVAFAATTGIMPLNMPESVLVRFKGDIQPNVTLRDLVHTIPYQAIQDGLLTIEKKGKKNVFSGRIIEIEGLPKLKVEQAFELTDATAERSATGCTIKLDEQPVVEYLESNIVMLKWMVAQGYNDRRTIERLIRDMEEFVANPQLMEADKDAEYEAVIEIDLNKVTEPILCVPNDPDDVRLLSEVAGQPIDEVFIGSCMTNIGHFRAAGNLLAQHKGELPTRLWVAPPTKMDRRQLIEEGYYDIFRQVGARIEIPGCSLCMGNQARVTEGATVVSTSTRNFPNRLGTGANVFLASSELAAVASVLGYLPDVVEYQRYSKAINTKADTYHYLKFDQLGYYTSIARDITR